MLSFGNGMSRGASVPGLSYILSNTLYIAITDVSNANTLISTRGPSFVMPPESGFQPLGEYEPDAEELAAIVDRHYAEAVDITGLGENDNGVAFAGLGEPTLRLDTLLATVQAVRERRHGVPFRVITNGLVPDPVSTAEALYSAGVKRASVSLMTSNPKQYKELMRPSGDLGHRDVLNFIVALCEAGVQTECTAVKSPGVNVRAAKELAEALGAVGFRERLFFP